MSRAIVTMPEKPVLDEQTFQQLLAAAHVLQKEQDALQSARPGSHTHTG